MYSGSSIYAQARSQFLKPTTVFMISTMLVNGGNYLYNLAIGRVLGPEDFAEAGILMSLILVVSFIGMTFQMVATKYSLELDGDHQLALQKLLKRVSTISGISLALLLMVTATKAATFLNLKSEVPLYIFALCMPAYFGMSYRRGLLQGGQQFLQLAGSYQAELWIKVLITVLLFLVFPEQPGILIASAMTLSIILGVFTTPKQSVATSDISILSREQTRQIARYAFFIILYEGIQILINYGDLMMVNHYFDRQTAGLYTSLSIIGRMVYFMTWMLVMVLIPYVLQNRKSGKPYHHLMHLYLGFIAAIVALLVGICYLIPRPVIQLLFGPDYLSLASHLWLYALATGLFALSNLFLYYFIALERFKPVYFAAALAVGQLIAYHFYHRQISNIIEIQVVAMSLLLITMVLYYFWSLHQDHPKPAISA